MTISALRPGLFAFALRSIVCVILIGAASTATAQDSLLTGLPGNNVNIIGPTPNPAHVREVALRQQNEPACAVRSDNPAYILCTYNDYRATDFPLIQGDSWIGLSMTPDFGNTWFSRLAPGFKAHANSLGMDFAADPNVVSVPGNSPGIAIVSYIAANRDLNDGVLAVQRLAEMPQEDINFWVAEDQIRTPGRTNNGRFADRPTMLAIVDPPELQTTQSITMQLEDGSTVVRDVPSGRLIICYSIFTGSNSSKVVCMISFDWGETFDKIVKLSEEQVRVQGVVVTNIGNTLYAAWRRADSNKGLGNAIVTSVSTDGGLTWSKGRASTQLCPIDQGATGAQIRLLDIPAIANDGEFVYLIASDRRFAGDQDCATGIPKAVVTWSRDGRNWSNLQPLDVGSDSPFGEPSGDGFQYITAAVGFRKNVLAVWYDTRRETPLPQPETSQMRDYVATGGIVNRKSDIYAVKIRRDEFDVPQISPAVRVSRYRTLLYDPATGQPLPAPQETEAHFPNTPIFEDGTRAFNGDYISAAVAWFRRQNEAEDPDGPWIQNSLTTGNDALDMEDVYITWGDGRDLRGNYLVTADDQPSPYTPNNAAMGMAREQQDKFEKEDKEVLFASADPAKDTDAESRPDPGLRTESVGDTPGTFGECNPNNPQDRTRDANVRGSMLKSVTSFAALTLTKPLVGFQRTIPVVITNPELDIERTLRLKIMNHPSDWDEFVEHTGHASWLQLPSKPPLLPGAEEEEILVSIPPNSVAARTLFLISNDTGASVTVNLYDSGCVPDAPDCPALSSITVGGGTSLIDSAFCEGNPSATCESVNTLETHDPDLQNPDLQSPDLQSVRLLSPDLQSPDLQSPDLQSPDLQSLGFESPDLQSPDLQSPDLQSPDLQSPDLQSPDLQSPDLQSASYADVSYTVKSIGNVTTTFSADMSFPGLNANEISAQLIASAAYVTGTSRDCEFLPVVENQILASKNLTTGELTSITLPTVDNPFAGPISYAARPGQVVTITLRIFGPTEQLSLLSDEDFIAGTGFGVSAHACNDPNNIDPTIDCLTIGVEKILSDKSGPAFVGLVDGDVIPATPLEADRPGGACLDLVGGADPLVSATDPSGIADISCTLVSTGEQICSTSEPGLSIELMSNPLDPSTATQVSCTATDKKGNSNTIQIGVAVADRTPPTISGTPTAELFADALTGTAVLALEDGLTATDFESVDANPVISCIATGDSINGSAISGEPVGPGFYDVSCVATDASSNVSSPEFTYMLTVIDDTPPTLVDVPDNITGFEATGPDGATVTYATPTASDTAGDATVECTPASGTTFALQTTTVTCTATDAGGNTFDASFTVEVVDTTPPDINVLQDPLVVSVDSSRTASADFEANIDVTDVVDQSPDFSCETASGAVSGDPLPIGETPVTCTTSDDSGNQSSASFSVQVQYGSSFGIDFPKGRIKAGSSVQLTFGWLGSDGARIDSSDADPVVSARTCQDPSVVVLNPGEFPGNSEIRWDAAKKEWRMNWQSVFSNGDPIPGDTYCLQVKSMKTGQFIPGEGLFDRITVRD